MIASELSHAFLLAAAPGRLNSIVGWILFAVVSAIILFLLVFVVICLWEKQHLKGDLEPAQPPFAITPIPYWAQTREDAARLGLLFAGDFATRKQTNLSRGLVTFFFSPDHQILTHVVGTSTAGAKLKKTVFRTRLTDGRIIESTDNPGTRDVTRGIESRVLLNAGVEELMGLHRLRVRNAGSPPLPFTPDAALAEHERIELDRGERLVARKLARWVNAEQTCLRLNLRGAFAYLADMFSSMSQLEKQTSRVDIKRAG